MDDQRIQEQIHRAKDIKQQVTGMLRQSKNIKHGSRLYNKLQDALKNADDVIRTLSKKENS